MSSHDTPSDAGKASTDASPVTPDEHRQVWDTIAWVVAGTATPEQQRLVQAHLPHCAHCRDEALGRGSSGDPGRPLPFSETES